eukprot:gnl/MRDRNA2_/MRDRNA2_84152_c0_seq1.p1 gnl/MRDRNA2_/MRDRNA2_84152_c0~~gnl/MRDRNA2_/MRDRNA2_84152_c0_seq1.p1  ORF type:complete len:312 (+),score=56.83 gnl/MRDRNA2_/MRDRNA2_84152_c0_seq1:112-1047(+)
MGLRVRHSTKSGSLLMQTHGVKSEVEVRVKNADAVKPLSIFSWKFISAFAFFQWITWGDRMTDNVQQMLINEYEHVGLISALLLTVVGAFLSLANEAVLDGIFVLITQVSVFFFLIATGLCVMNLLALNEVGTETACQQYADRMGWVLQVPITCMLMGFACFFLSLFWWFYLNTTLEWAIANVAVSMFLMLALWVPPYTLLIKNVWIVTQTTTAMDHHELVITLSDQQLEDKFNSYMSSVGGEMIDPELWLEYLITHTEDKEVKAKHQLAYVTKKRAELLFAREADKLLKSQNGTNGAAHHGEDDKVADSL